MLLEVLNGLRKYSHRLCAASLWISEMREYSSIRHIRNDLSKNLLDQTAAICSKEERKEKSSCSMSGEHASINLNTQVEHLYRQEATLS